MSGNKPSFIVFATGLVFFQALQISIHSFGHINSKAIALTTRPPCLVLIAHLLLKCLLFGKRIEFTQISFCCHVHVKLLFQASTLARCGPRLTGDARNDKLSSLLQTGWKEVEGRDAIFKEFVFKNFNQVLMGRFVI